MKTDPDLLKYRDSANFLKLIESDYDICFMSSPPSVLLCKEASSIETNREPINYLFQTMLLPIF